MHARELAARLRVPRGAAAGALSSAPLLVAIGVVLVWSADEGGYSVSAWYPGALLILGLLATGWIADPRRLLSLDRRTKLALSFFAAFAVWNFASIGWATSQGAAWDGANRTLLYLSVFALFASAEMTTKTAIGLLVVYASGVAAVGMFTIEQALHSSDPASLFLYSRLSDPTGYSNATAALFLLPAWPLLVVASNRGSSLLLRGVALGLTGLLIELALLPQSRGAVFSIPIVALAYLVLVPGRLRNGVLLALVGVVVWLARHPILAVYSHPPGDPAFASTLSSARTTLVVTFAILLTIGAVVAAADRRIELPDATLVVLRRSGAIAVAALLAGVVVFGLVTLGGPTAAARSAWHSFKGGEPVGTTRFVGLGSHRYDFWRVSLDVFREHPLGGVGTDNFAIQYLRDRRSLEEPLYPHSLEMRLLEQTGVVGALLFASAIAVALVTVFRRRRGEAAPEVRATAAAMVVGFGYWILHGSFDWLWYFPALGAAAFALLGTAVALSRPAPAPARPVGGHAPALAVAGVVALLLFALPSYGLPWAASLEVNAAAAGWRTNPEATTSQIRMANRLNRLSDTADVIGAVIASKRRDYARMRVLLKDAIARNPGNWYSHLDLAAAESMLGEQQAAIRSAAVAHRLNPRESLASAALRTLRLGRTFDPAHLDAVLLYRTRNMR